MSIIDDLLKDIPIPRMVRIRQKFDATALENPLLTLEEELKKPGIKEKIKPGHEVAICVGSRGIANIAGFTKIAVKVLQEAGAKPFIVPTMGSHGGATAEGQAEVLAHLGITEETVGAPIRSSMEVDKVDELPNGLPVYVAKHLLSADAVIVMNRVKPHTAFRGHVESGIMKMISIGLGKQKGADACHQLGFKHMAENVPAMAKAMINKLPPLIGVALVENAFDETCMVEAMPSDVIEERETELLKIAKARLAKIYFGQIDVLVVDYIGKNISGDGADPNITGRYPTPYAYGGPDVSKMVVLNLTPETEGNANGVGTADFTTQRVIDVMNREVTYANGLTSTVCSPTKIATTLKNDLYALKAAIKTSNILKFDQCRLVRIKDTLHIGEIEISEAMLEEAKNNPNIEVLSEPYELSFDELGNLF